MTEHRNAERVRYALESLIEGNIEPMNCLWTDDVIFYVPGNHPFSGVYRGKEQVFGFFGRVAEETAGTFRDVIHDVLANDVHTASILQIMGERHGKRLDQQAVIVQTLNAEGKATELRLFMSDEHASNEFWA